MIAARIARFRRAIGRSWFLPSFLILFGLSLSWVLASPVGAVPDEPAHSIKAAAVARGQLLGTQTGTDGPLLAVEVPRYIAQVNDMSCFAREVDKTPRCASELGGNSDEMVTAVTTAGLYNPVYYAIIGWPSLTTSGLKAFYVMRICSAFLSCLFLASAFGAVSLLARRKWALVTLSVAITPMVLFLNGAVNPNSLEYATTAAIAANLLLLLERTTSDRLPVVPILVTTAAAALLANTKALSLLWLLVVVVAVAITATSAQLRRLVTNPAVLAGAAFIGLSSVMAIMWILRHDSLSSKPFEGAGMSPADGAEIMLDRTFTYMIGWIGQFGWLELNAPVAVISFWMGMIFAVSMGVLFFTRGRARTAALLLSLSLVALPVILQAQIINQQGIVWQGRYVLAVFVPFMLLAGVAIDRSATNPIPPGGRKALAIVLGMVFVAQVSTFVWVLRRYTTGLALDVRWIEMVVDPQWQPPLGTLAVVAIFTVVTALGALLLRRHINTDELPPRESAASNEEPTSGASNEEPTSGATTASRHDSIRQDL
ncbi:hypothetical protein QFZ40_001243 [Arthrobacter pascens]|uniref:DUF2142 domain-containing protein n=1 Tax=Arthrobacter pascens TaxID=1677 RepID=UPI00277F0078|nr:DUF2142 domain-containing protein [Arthrobacter pascens]MDQ0633334.1 hypothetical protein [Arthrobacter pascens]